MNELLFPSSQVLGLMNIPGTYTSFPGSFNVSLTFNGETIFNLNQNGNCCIALY